MSATVQIITGQFRQVDLRDARQVQDLRQVASDMLKCNTESLAFINRNKLCEDLDEIEDGQNYMAIIIIGGHKAFKIMTSESLRLYGTRVYGSRTQPALPVSLSQ
jgi:hypothetical protein